MNNSKHKKKTSNPNEKGNKPDNLDDSIQKIKQKLIYHNNSSSI